MAPPAAAHGEREWTRMCHCFLSESKKRRAFFADCQIND